MSETEAKPRGEQRPDGHGWHEVSADLGRVLDERRADEVERRAAELAHAALPLWRRIARRVVRVIREEIRRG